MPHDTVVGHIAIGRLVLEIGEPHGAALREAMRAERAHLRPRPAPILLRPRLIRGLLDRQIELAAAFSALDAGMLLEVSGEPGIGKTALLRHLAHHPRAAAFADGIVYLSARNDSSIDLLRRIFDAFYENDTPAQPTIAEIRRGLQDKQALILLDDVRASQDELDLALDSAPRCAFVVGARERCVWGELRSLALTGLPIGDAVALLEREVERSFGAEERSTAEFVCAAIAGHPLRIQQAAALIRERALPADAWIGHITSDNLIAELMSSSDDKQRRILLALSALTGVPIEIHHVTGIAEVTDVETLLMPLVHRGLVLVSQSRYLLADGVTDRLRRTEDLKPWVNRAITYFTAWAERHRRSAGSLLDASDALVRVQEHAAEMKRWGEALRLGKLVEATLVLHGRWEAWGIVIDRCLAAARAIGDRPLEAWALHEIGTRAVCLGNSTLARRVLTQAATARDQLGEPAAAAVSRQNLGFIPSAVPSSVDEPEERPLKRSEEPPVTRSEEPPVTRPQGRPAIRFGDIFETNSLVETSSLVLRTTPAPSRSGSRWAERAALVLTFVLSAIFGGLAYDATSGGGVIFKIPGRAQPVATAATSTVATAAASTVPTPHRTALETRPTAPPASQVLQSETASIHIFTARPGSIATSSPTDLCYAVSDAVETRIEPGIGQVDAAHTLTCRRVAPARTTTYELTAVGRDGAHVKQQVVIVVR